MTLNPGFAYALEKPVLVFRLKLYWWSIFTSMRRICELRNTDPTLHWRVGEPVPTDFWNMDQIHPWVMVENQLRRSSYTEQLKDHLNSNTYGTGLYPSQVCLWSLHPSTSTTWYQNLEKDIKAIERGNIHCRKNLTHNIISCWIAASDIEYLHPLISFFPLKNEQIVSHIHMKIKF